MYFAVKHSHLLLVLISVVLFCYRFAVHKLLGKELPKLLKILPHVIDTLLLISAAALCVIIQQYPFVHGWITIKLGFVIGYIVFAIMAMKAPEKSKSTVMLALSSICLVFAAYMAVTKGVA